MNGLMGAGLLAVVVVVAGCAKDEEPQTMYAHGSGSFEPATVRRIVDNATVVVIGVVGEPIAEVDTPASGSNDSLGRFTTWSVSVDTVLKGEAGPTVHVVTYPDDAFPAQFGSGEALLLALTPSSPAYGESFVPVGGLNGVWEDESDGLNPKRVPFADSGEIAWSTDVITELAAESEKGTASDVSGWAQTMDGICAAVADSVIAVRQSASRAIADGKEPGADLAASVDKFTMELRTAIDSVADGVSTTLTVVSSEAATFNERASAALDAKHWVAIDEAIHGLGWVLYDAGATSCAVLT